MDVVERRGLTSTRIGAKSKTYGVDASNASRFDLNSMPFTLTYGGSFKLEDAELDYRLRTEVQGILGSIAPDGRRQIGTLFAKGKWEPMPWLAFDAGSMDLTDQVAATATQPYWSYKGLPYTGYEGSGVSPKFRRHRNAAARLAAVRQIRRRHSAAEPA